MFCSVCGRSLVGLRADHPVQCRIEADLRLGRSSLVVAKADPPAVAAPSKAVESFGARWSRRFMRRPGRAPRAARAA